MKRLINRILVKLGLREPPPMYDPCYFEEYNGVLHAFLPDKIMKWNGKVWVGWLDE